MLHNSRGKHLLYGAVCCKACQQQSHVMQSAENQEVMYNAMCVICTTANLNVVMDEQALAYVQARAYVQVHKL